MSQLTVWASFGLTKPNPAKSCLDTISIFSLELTSSEVSINVSGTPINWIYEQFSPLVHTYTRQAEDVRLPRLPTRYRNIINVGIQVWTEDHCVILQARPPQCEGWGLWSDLSEWQEAGERERERERLCHVGDSGHKWIALHCNKTPAMGYVWNFWFVLCIRLEEVEWFCKFPVSLIITT